MIKKNNANAGFLVACILIYIGLLGAVFFFPMNIQSRYTCLYDRMMSTVATGHNLEMGGLLTKTRAESAYLFRRSGAVDTSKSDGPLEYHIMMSSMHHGRCMNPLDEKSDLVHRYLFPFGFLWWGSLILTITGAFLLKRHFS